jgi:RNA polymerase sigma-70 factor (ECF subfamily)
MTKLQNVQHAAADDCLIPADSYPRCDTKACKYDDGLHTFLAMRRNLFGIAYRMVGCASEAEDIVQEVWVRWQTTNWSLVLDPPAFLATTTIRLCINLCRSARVRHETYIGEWLSEPVDSSADPSLDTERKEALRSAVGILLEKLRPIERAVYLLREAFDYSYRNIADILRMKEPAVRQLLTRARKRIAHGRRKPVKSAERRRLLDAVTDATQNGNIAALERLFASDAISCRNRVRVVQ